SRPAVAATTTGITPAGVGGRMVDRTLGAVFAGIVGLLGVGPALSWIALADPEVYDDPTARSLAVGLLVAVPVAVGGYLEWST
ncbi:MAG: hypothetical protein R6V31_01140, partial [Halohasta sp.]